MGILERIKHQMDMYGISYRQLSDETGIALSTLHYRLNSTDRIDIDFVQLIAPYLHTTPEYLFGWEDEVDEITEQMYARYNILFDKIKKVSLDDLKIVEQMVERLQEEDG